MPSTEFVEISSEKANDYESGSELLRQGKTTSTGAISGYAASSAGPDGAGERMISPVNLNACHNTTQMPSIRVTPDTANTSRNGLICMWGSFPPRSGKAAYAPADAVHTLPLQAVAVPVLRPFRNPFQMYDFSIGKEKGPIQTDEPFCI